MLITAWGKLHRDNSGASLVWHPLVDHLHDVAACFDALIRCSNIRRAAEATAQRKLSDQDLARLGALVFLHDLGKANAGFQAKRFNTGEQPEYWRVTPTGHSGEALLDVAWDLYEKHLPLTAMAKWGSATECLLIASISHHGRPVVAPQGTDYAIWKDVQALDGSVKYSPSRTVRDIARAVQERYPQAFVDRGARLPESPAFGHWFAGIVQLADWLGSDTRFFPYSQSGEVRSETVARYATTAVTTLGLDAEIWRAPLREVPRTFSEALGIPKPWPFQQTLGELPLEQLLILESETGSGKTEAVLWRYLQLFQAGAVDGLYFALPTRAAATQLYERLCRFVMRVWPDDAPMVVRALPGYAAVDTQEIKARLPNFQVLWADEPCDAQAHRRWAGESAKRFLAAPIAVGTLDQALLAALQVRHAHLRHALLARSLLIIDEVHASDAYMGAITEHLLRSHLAAGGHALLLSATLGSTARSRYQATLRPVGDLPRTMLSIDEASALPYPGVTIGADLPRPVVGCGQQKTVHWRLWPVIDDAAAVAARALQIAKQGARVLVIRNTVANAIATLHAVEAAALASAQFAALLTVNGIATLHHSRFSKQCRPLLDRAVEAQIGKQRSDLEGRIVIGTQTLEQSLDLDADLLITDLCPMDVLLQRVGRLHRHDRPAAQRPSICHEAHAIVLAPTDESWPTYLKRARNGLGRFRDGGGVYPDLRILEATRRLIDAQPTRRIPQDNRILVEQATHPNALAAVVEAGGPDWQAHQQSIEGAKGGERSLGNLNSLAFQRTFCHSPFANNDEVIATRLGAADRLVDFNPPLVGPFGTPVRQMAIRYHLLPKHLPVDLTPAIIDADESGFTFGLKTAHYRYGRIGIERLGNDNSAVQEYQGSNSS